MKRVFVFVLIAVFILSVTAVAFAQDGYPAPATSTPVPTDESPYPPPATPVPTPSEPTAVTVDDFSTTGESSDVIIVAALLLSALVTGAFVLRSRQNG